MGAQNEKTNVAIIVDSDDDEIEISERKPIENKSSPKKSIIKKNDASPTEASNKQSAKTASSPQRSLNTSSPQRSVNASISQRSLNTSNPQRPLNASNPQRSLNASSPQRPPNTSNPQRPKDASSLTPQRATSIIQREPVLPPLMGKEPSVNVNRLFQRDNRVKALGKAKPKPRPQSANILNDLIGNDDGLAEILGEKPKTLPYSPSLDDMRARRPSGASQEQSCSSPRGNSDIILSPDRPIQYRSIFSLNGLDSPPAPSRKRPMASPEVNSPISRYAMEKRRVVYEVDDEDGEEEDLESYIYHVTSRRRLFEKEISEIAGKKPGATNIQCPICYLFFLKDNILEHAAECDGKKAEKGIRKNTIAAAVAQSERERKKRNKGIIDTGPTNYYADSEGALALDGTGFGSEVTAGLSWESAGQTRFG